MSPANDHSHNDREERAIDALIAGILRPPHSTHDIQPEEIAPYVGSEEPPLSSEAEAALAKLGPNPLAGILSGARECLQPASAPREEFAIDYSGMYRKNPTGENSPEDEQELERRRRETLMGLNENEQKTKDPSHGEEH